jgi:YbbR domain-containing protein
VLNTAPVDVSGAQAEVVRTVAISRPQGVTVVRDLAATVRVTILPLQGQQVRDVAVSTANVPEALGATIFPPVVSVSISGPQPTLARLTAQDVTVSVDASGLAAGQYARAVTVRAPEGIRIDRTLPDQVTLTLTAS